MLRTYSWIGRAHARVSQEIEIFRDRGIGKMKERIIAATGIYRECRCNRRSGPGRERTGGGRRYQMRRLIAAPMAVGCTLVPVTCYLVLHDAGQAEGSNLGLARRWHVPRGHRWLFKTHLSAPSSIGRSHTIENRNRKLDDVLRE